MSIANSLALITSEPAGKRYSTLRPCGKNDLPFGNITISWLLVSGLSLPSFSVASVGLVIGFRYELNRPVPSANLTLGILPIAFFGPPKSWIKPLMPSIPSFGILMTALIPLPAKSFKPFHMSLKPFLTLSHVSLKNLAMLVKASVISLVILTPNLSCVNAPISSHFFDRNFLEFSQPSNQLLLIPLWCLSISLPREVMASVALSLTPFHVLDANFLTLSHLSDQSFLRLLMCFAIPLAISLTWSTVPSTNFLNGLLCLYINSKPATTGLEITSSFLAVLVKALIPFSPPVK